MASCFSQKSLLLVGVWLLSVADAIDLPDESLFKQSVAFTFDTRETYIECWYPVSGTYGRLPRILFYCTIVFGLFASQNQWLVAGALASAFTYSGMAAVHMCLLLWPGPLYGELDFYAMLAILITSFTITIPMLNWSSTLRHLGSRDGRKSGTRTLILYWACLIALGLFSTFTYLNRPFELNQSTLNPITCVPPGSKMNLTVGQDPSWRFLGVTSEWLQENGCIDPCKVSAPNLAKPVAIFRSQAELQVMSLAEVHKNQMILNGPLIAKYFSLGAGIAIFVLIQAVWAALFGRRTPQQCRDTIYLSLKSLRLQFFCLTARRTPPEAWGCLPMWMAKCVATMAYLWAVTATIACLMSFVVSIVAMEFIMTIFPQNETANHVGAWGPWLTVLLIILASFIARFHCSVAAKISSSFNQAFRIRTASNSTNGQLNTSSMLGSEEGIHTRLRLRIPRALDKLTKWGRYCLRLLWELFLGRLIKCTTFIQNEWLSLKWFWEDLDWGDEAVKA